MIAGNVPEQLACQVIEAVRGHQNPVLRLRIVEALLDQADQLRTERRAAVLQLRSESWTWPEIGAEIGVGNERVWQLGNDL